MPTVRRKKPSSPTLRFAHPFFTTKPIAERGLLPGIPGTRLLDHIAQHLQPVPKASGDAVMPLDQVIGSAGSSDIASEGTIQFHTVGDTGRSADSPQGDVAEAMTKDFDVAHPAKSPAFFLHLGDVIYGNDKDQRYRREFYEPYVHYPGKIVGIPGNHDGEVFARTDPTTLRAFQANFCADRQAVPPIAGTIFRQTMNQPGVYWLLDAPFVHIVGLYSNAAENPGFISGTIPGNHQKQWLIKTLKNIKHQRDQGERKALVFATHHPPFTAGGHSPSHDMLADIDDACNQGRLVPDLFLSGHAHSYQRYTRTITFQGRRIEIPFLVAGTGGINDQAVPPATGQTTDDHVFVKSRKGYGYLRVAARGGTLAATFVAVEGTARQDFDVVQIDLASGRVG